jgi:hypothetical protein
MSEKASQVRHMGKMTVITLCYDSDSLNRLRAALREAKFQPVNDVRDAEQFNRRLVLTDNDWPMNVMISRESELLTFQVQMFIPWSWIIGLALFLVCAAILLVFLTGNWKIGLIAIVQTPLVLFAAFNRTFDLSPRAIWQAPPRRRWGKRLNQLIVNAFGIENA